MKTVQEEPCLWTRCLALLESQTSDTDSVLKMVLITGSCAALVVNLRFVSLHNATVHAYMSAELIRHGSNKKPMRTVISLIGYSLCPGRLQYRSGQ